MSQNLRRVALMNEHEQFYYLICHSEFLIARQEDHILFSLYSCDDFFIELQFDHTGNGIHTILLFTETDKLDPYLTLIDLRELKS